MAPERARPSGGTKQTGGQVVDCKAADTLLDALPKTALLHGDKGYDSNAIDVMSWTAPAAA